MNEIRALSERRAELDHCAYCPKLCRHTCPVSEATGREALTPWGKMSVSFLAAGRVCPPDAALAETAFACTGCGRCRDFCRDRNDVPGTLAVARRVVVAAGLAGPGVRALLERFHRDGSPVGALSGALEASGAELASPPEVDVYFPGCTALVRERYDVLAAQGAGRALGLPLPLSRAAGLCCGYPLYAAGDHDAFARHARMVAAKLPAGGRLVVGDPGCAHTFRNLYPLFGVEPRCGITPLPEVLAGGLPKARLRRPLPERAVWHDPCHLARSLDCTAAPRQILGQALAGFSEPLHAGAETLCAGGGGAVPWSMPAVAEAMARARAGELSAEAPLVVTACPTAKRALQRGGTRVRDLAAVVAAWLEVAPKDLPP